MDLESNIFPWLTKGQPPDYKMDPLGLIDAAGPSDYILRAEDVCGGTFGLETTLKYPEMEVKSVYNDPQIDLDIPAFDECRVDEMLQALYTGLPMSPTTSGVSEHCQGLAQPSEDCISVECFLAGLEDSVAGDVFEFQPSKVDGEVSVPANSSKTGSQAFDYIGAAAVLETDGIPAPSRLGLGALDCGGANTPKASGILPINAKVLTDKVTSIITKPCGTVTADPKLFTVPEQFTSITTLPPNPCDTIFTDPKLTTVPEQVTSITTYPPKPCSTVSTDPKLTVVSDQVTSTEASTEDTSNAKKKRRRRRKEEGENGEGRKARLYEWAPLSDAKEERRRKDAVRAKNCRERKSMEVKELREKLGEMERERDQLAQEVAGRRSYEKAVLKVLMEKYKIFVTPYSTPSEQTTPPPQAETSE